ncbi:MAG: sigma-54-dependent Fis family transcriptional regulator, partial [Alphaproteobacteria bacterium]|nr:sigma-54-dependent Fis family transcriptional regulator [Alphaproteobacteria bacterium]
MPGRLLIVDDERIAVRNLEHVMRKDGYEVLTAYSGSAALTILETQPVDIVLTDLKMERVDGMQVLRRCHEILPESEVIVITGYATLESAVGAMKQGAFNYIAKPFRLDEVRRVVAEAMEKIHLKRENSELRKQLERFEGKVKILTQDTAMQRLLEVARQVAPTDCNVIITGASGTGKELIARYVHASSNRADGPFLAVNCGAFTEDLLANELFGHDKGAFTGATTEKSGLIEAAAGGTLFLDEITEMAPAMQVKLLRVIQEREFMRVGSTDLVKVDVRFIAATNRDPLESVKNGAFRADLYYRLNVVNLHVMPLVRRAGDIPLLAYYFLRRFSGLMKKAVSEIGPDALDLLKTHDYPGNVRELQNIIERAVAICTGTQILPSHLPD